LKGVSLSLKKYFNVMIKTIKPWTYLLFVLTIFPMSFSSCVKDDSSENGPDFENYFNLGLEYYTVNNSNVFWNANIQSLNVRSNQGAIIVLGFNSKPKVSQKYTVVRPDDLSKSPNNCSVTLITPDSNLEYFTSTGATGSVFNVQVENERIGVDYANVELATLRNGALTKETSNGKFYSR
jgi:hypothetical protein